MKKWKNKKMKKWKNENINPKYRRSLLLLTSERLVPAFDDDKSLNPFFHKTISLIRMVASRVFRAPLLFIYSSHFLTTHNWHQYVSIQRAKKRTKHKSTRPRDLIKKSLDRWHRINNWCEGEGDLKFDKLDKRRKRTTTDSFSSLFVQQTEVKAAIRRRKTLKTDGQTNRKETQIHEP